MSWIRNALLTLAATAVGIAIVELLLFPLLLPSMPTTVLAMTHEFGNVLAQSSKAGVIPRDYILLTGDSYAEGEGDALTTAELGSRGPYSSAHFLSERLDRDVVTVGKSDRDNTESSLEVSLFASQRRLSLLYDVPPPSEIVYYFYEGNDLQDNLRWLAAQGESGGEPGRIAALVEARRDAASGLRMRLEVLAEANFPALHFIGKAALLKVIQPMTGRRRTWVPRPAGPDRAIVDGHEVGLPRQLQSPPLDLSEGEWSAATLVLRASLKLLRDQNPGIPISVIYIPSPLSSYDLVGDTVTYFRSARPAATLDEIEAMGLRLRRTVCETARDLGFAFGDVSSAIREAGRKAILHGPSDWYHFNLVGYRALGLAVADWYTSPGHAAPPETCDPRPLARQQELLRRDRGGG